MNENEAPTEAGNPPQQLTPSETPMEDRDNILPKGVRVPHPRWPYFINVSFSNWFRTTVNPLVWHLVDAREFPLPFQRTHVFAAGLDSGLWIDAWRWSSAPFWDGSATIERKVTCRPDALLHPELMLEVFVLLTSGRIKDRARAKRILDLLSKAHAGSEPQWSQPFPELNPGVKNHTWGAALPGRQGREKLAASLRSVLIIWREAEQGGRRVGRPRKGAGVNPRPVEKSSSGEYRNALMAYRALLDESGVLQRAASELYGAESLELGSVPLRTLEDAIVWLESHE